jgi:hypothetical protein
MAYVWIRLERGITYSGNYVRFYGSPSPHYFFPSLIFRAASYNNCAIAIAVACDIGRVLTFMV